MTLAFRPRAPQLCASCRICPAVPYSVFGWGWPRPGFPSGQVLVPRLVFTWAFLRAA